MQLLSEVRGVKTPVFDASHFSEFTVNFDRTGKTVDNIHRVLLRQHKTSGGKDVSSEFPELGKTALYCVTEMHSEEEIERLANGMQAVVSRRKR